MIPEQNSSQHALICCPSMECKQFNIYLAGNLYTRPPSVIVATAFQRCARGDWDAEQHDWSNYLSWLSLYNKLNFARLHASSLHIFALWVRC